MIDLKDFFHLPEVDTLLAQVVGDRRGMVVVAGLGPRSAQPAAGVPAPSRPSSDRATVAAILLRQILDRPVDERKVLAAVVGLERGSLRMAEYQRPQVEFVAAPIDHVDGFTTGLQKAMMYSPDLLLIDRLNTVTAQATFHAAATGRRVLTQIDTALVGGEVLQEIVGLGCSPSQMSLVAWVVAVHRVPALCAHCKQPHQPGPTLVETMAERHNLEPGTTFYAPSGCAQCHGTGYNGELTAFDIFRVHGGVTSFSELVSTPSLLPLEGYLARLAAQGYVALEDAARLVLTSPYKTRPLPPLRPDASSEVSKLVELETANKLLAQRLEALTSLLEFNQTLAAFGPVDAADHIVRYARELCGADRAILYVIDQPGVGRVAAVDGWERSNVGRRVPLPASLLERGDPDSVANVPPGISVPPDQVETIQTSLRVPLVAGDALLGVLMVNSRNKTRFTLGTVALLKQLGLQVGLALQHGQRFETLQAKVATLEAAQAGQVEARQRERERELAHDLQRQWLPDRLPSVAGVQLAAVCRTAPDVGADAFSVIDLGGGRLGLSIADVAGFGLDAAVQMSVVQALIHVEAPRTDSPREVLTQVNRGLPGDVFLTAFYGIYEVATRRLAYCRAGHTRPLWLRTDGHNVLLGTVGMPLGMFDAGELDLAEGEVFLSPGDTLLLYSNGLIDALDPHGTEFGLKHWVNRARENVDLPPERLCAALFDEVAEFQSGAAQRDDMALVVMRALGS